VTRDGLLPLSSPVHFSSIQLGSMFEVLPQGVALDLHYVLVGTASAVAGAQIETALEIRAYGATTPPPDKVQQHASNSASSLSASMLLLCVCAAWPLAFV
jgi:hypothetical protein